MRHLKKVEGHAVDFLGYSLPGRLIIGILMLVFFVGGPVMTWWGYANGEVPLILAAAAAVVIVVSFGLMTFHFCAYVSISKMQRRRRHTFSAG